MDRDCNATGTACECGFFAEVTYTFDASTVDWSTVSFVTINVNHINLDGSRAMTAGARLDRRTPTFTTRVYGCAPRIEVRRDYAFSGRSCAYTDTVTRTDITIPSVTRSKDGVCSTAAL